MPRDWPECCELGAKDFYNGKPLTLYEITEDAFWWGLECVPPAMQRSASYLCGEPMTHNRDGQEVCTFAVQMGERFYGGPLLTVQQAKSLTEGDIRQAIERGEGVTK